MKKSNFYRLSDAIDLFMKTNRLDDKMLHNAVISQWEKIAGKLIADETENMYFGKQKLYIKVKSPAMKYELNMQKSMWCEVINAYAKKVIVEEIIVM